VGGVDADPVDGLVREHAGGLDPLDERAERRRVLRRRVPDQLHAAVGRLRPKGVERGVELARVGGWGWRRHLDRVPLAGLAGPAAAAIAAAAEVAPPPAPAAVPATAALLAKAAAASAEPAASAAAAAAAAPAAPPAAAVLAAAAFAAPPAAAAPAVDLHDVRTPRAIGPALLYLFASSPGVPLWLCERGAAPALLQGSTGGAGQLPAVPQRAPSSAPAPAPSSQAPRR